MATGDERDPTPDDASVATASLVDRRTFLRMSVAATTLLACADDGSPIGEGETGETGTEGNEDDIGETGTTSETGTTGETDTTGESDTTSESDTTETGDGDGDADCEGSELAFDPEAVAVDEAIFPLALMAGEMQQDSVLLAIYIEDAQPKLLRVWRPSDTPGSIRLIAEQEVVPDADGYAKVEVVGLCPGSWYSYAYFVGEPGNPSARSRIAEFRTAIAHDSLEPLTVACSACNGSSLDWPALERSAEEYYDIFLHLGDMAYNDGAFTKQEYRDSWKSYLGAEGFKSVYALAGLYATWDDHEITDNGDFDRETMDPVQLERRMNALSSYFEVLPIAGGEPDYKLWRSFRWGLTAEFIVLDSRYERKPSQGLYMSQAQMQWLQETLANSPCHFKVILNSVPITNMPLIWDVAAGDRWEGFPNSRNALLNFIDQQQINNVWFISGDFHVCFVSRIDPSGNNLSSRCREIAMTGGNTNVLGNTLSLLNPDQFVYGTGSPRGCIITFDPGLHVVNVRFIEDDGTVDFDQDLTLA